MDKKGMSTIQLIVFAFFAFFVVIFAGAAIYGLSIFDGVMSGVNLNINGQNFSAIYESTMGQGIDAVLGLADIFCVSLLFGMIIVMMIVGYYWGDDKKRLWIIFDLFIIIAVYILAVYLQNYFLTFLGTNAIDSTIYTDQLPKASRILTSLPYLIPSIGALIMVVTYGLAKRRSEASAYSDLGY